MKISRIEYVIIDESHRLKIIDYDVEVQILHEYRAGSKWREDAEFISIAPHVLGDFAEKIQRLNKLRAMK